jgi:hypothetical protein
MSAPDSVTNWLVQLKAGDPAAAQALWEPYFPRMVALARQRLAGARRREADEEDVALSAFDCFCRGAEQGRFPDAAGARPACSLCWQRRQPSPGPAREGGVS